MLVLRGDRGQNGYIREVNDSRVDSGASTEFNVVIPVVLGPRLVLVSKTCKWLVCRVCACDVLYTCGEEVHSKTRLRKE